MTELEYKELLHWCRSKTNQGTKEFSDKYKIKTEAVSIRQHIDYHKRQIKANMRYLEWAKSDDVKAKYIARINDEKEWKKMWMDEFFKLNIPS